MIQKIFSRSQLTHSQDSTLASKLLVSYICAFTRLHISNIPIYLYSSARRELSIHRYIGSTLLIDLSTTLHIITSTQRHIGYHCKIGLLISSLHEFDFLLSSPLLIRLALKHVVVTGNASLLF